jgi:hypothetical protein
MAAPPAEPCGMDGYLALRDVRVDLDLGAARGGGGGEGGTGGGGGFTVCFWLYLSGPARPSSVILHQVRIDSTLLFFFPRFRRSLGVSLLYGF